MTQHGASWVQCARARLAKVSILERLRRAARAVLGRTAIYPVLSWIVGFVAVAWNEGVKVWITLHRVQKAEDGGPVVSVAFQHLCVPIAVRPGRPDEVSCINNIVREEWGHFKSEPNPTWMIDAGAYIGDTTAYFLPVTSFNAEGGGARTIPWQPRTFADTGGVLDCLKWLFETQMDGRASRARARSGCDGSSSDRIGPAWVRDGAIQIHVALPPAGAERRVAPSLGEWKRRRGIGQ